MRQEAEEKAHQISQKLDFESQVYNQQIRELRDRLETATGTILSLETRIRQYSKSDTSVSGLLQQVRESAEEEMLRFKMESEENYARNVREKIISWKCWWVSIFFFLKIMLIFKNGTSCNFLGSKGVNSLF